MEPARTPSPSPSATPSEQLVDHRELWMRKPALRAVYADLYRRMVDAAGPGQVLEIGGGSGNFREFTAAAGSVVSTDIQWAPWLDAVADAHDLPFAAGRFDAIVMFDVLHHLARPRLFLAEAVRVLRPGGRIVWCEPAITPLSWVFYTLLHPEPVRLREDPLAGGRPEPERNPFDSNQAFPTLLMRRGGRRLVREVPELAVVAHERHSLLAYPLTGGFRPWSLISASLVGALLRVEDRLLPWLGWLMAFRQLVVLQRREVSRGDVGHRVSA